MNPLRFTPGLLALLALAAPFARAADMPAGHPAITDGAAAAIKPADLQFFET